MLQTSKLVVICLCHALCGHCSPAILMAWDAERCSRLCRYCELCQRHNIQAGAHRSNLHQLSVGAPMERVAFDILSFPDETAADTTCILVVCDNFTKWVEVFALPDHKAVSVADTLVTEVFLRFGAPRYLHSDQAPEFMGELMTELSVLLAIQHTLTCPYRPKSDGLVISDQYALHIFFDENLSDSDQDLPFLLCAYLATANASTRCSPNLLMLGHETNLPVDLMFPTVGYRGCRCHNEYVQRVKRFLEDNYEMVRQQLGAAAERQKCYYDAPKKSPIQGGGLCSIFFFTKSEEKAEFSIHWSIPHYGKSWGG